MADPERAQLSAADPERIIRQRQRRRTSAMLKRRLTMTVLSACVAGGLFFGTAAAAGAGGIDNTGDGVEDVAYRWDFRTRLITSR
jgi:hypothetical protein